MGKVHKWFPWGRNRDAIVGLYNHFQKDLKEVKTGLTEKMDKTFQMMSKLQQTNQFRFEEQGKRLAVLEEILKEEIKAKAAAEEKAKQENSQARKDALDKMTIS